MYDYIFNWLNTATKAERHCDEMEAFAKKHPMVFMKFHMLCRDLKANEVDSVEYLKAKEKVVKLFDSKQKQFEPVFEAIKRMDKKDV